MKQRVYIDDVYGEDYTTKFGNTISIGFSSEINEYGVSQFVAECNICSEDKELWPRGSLKVTIRNIRNRVASCGCSSTCRYTDRQREIQITRMCQGTGWIFKGFDYYPVVSNQTKAILYNPTSDTVRESLVCNLIKNGIKDFVIGSEKDEEVLQKFFQKYKKLYAEGTSVKRNMDLSEARKTILLSCPACGKQNSPIRKESIVKGLRPCKCMQDHTGYFHNRRNETDTLYLLRFEKEGEVFYKIGRSFNVPERIKSMCKQHKVYKVDVLSELKDCHKTIFDMETELHQILYRGGYHYTPSVEFSGYFRECFTKGCLWQEEVKDVFGL